jgi:transposase
LAGSLIAGKERLGSISKQGDRYLRGLFVAGALAVIRYAKFHILGLKAVAPASLTKGAIPQPDGVLTYPA